MAQVFVTPQAQRDIDEAISTLNLPDDTWARIARSLRTLETPSTALPSTNCTTASPWEISSPGYMRIVALASRRRFSK